MLVVKPSLHKWQEPEGRKLFTTMCDSLDAPTVVGMWKNMKNAGYGGKMKQTITTTDQEKDGNIGKDGV